MNIGIDGNEANIKNRVGVNKYAYEIIKGIYSLVNEPGASETRPVVIVYLKNEPMTDMPKETGWFKYKVLRGGGMWILTRLTPYLFSNPDKLNVFFTPSHYVPPIAPMPRVCSIMDLGYLEFSAQFTKKDYWQLRLWTAWSIRVSKYILTISEATKSDIVEHYLKAANKITVTYPGYDNMLITKGFTVSKNDLEKVRNKYSIVSNYLLYLGTLKPSKNVEGLIRAFHEIKRSRGENDRNFQLVIAGKKGWLYDSIFGLVKSLGLERDVVFTDFIDEVDKYALIAGAEIFILPSFWEGFGMDILTSFALKVPVVAANVGSLPEVVGNAGILIDPKNPRTIADAVNKILNMNKIEYNDMLERGVKRLGSFSWEKSARKTLEVIENV